MGAINSRSREMMPARLEEVENVMEEGVIFNFSPISPDS
jgi:hypothetical protein